MTVERVVLVSPADEEIGTEEKLRAHELSLMHRAFSIFVVDPNGRVLLQRRADEKYHSAGLWSNATCGHPRPGEATDAAAHRRLLQEMGLDCSLVEVAHVTYCLDVSAELVEHELNHVFVGCSESDPTPDPAEASDWAWWRAEDLDRAIAETPSRFSAWLPIVWRVVHGHLTIAAER